MYFVYLFCWNSSSIFSVLATKINAFFDRNNQKKKNKWKIKKKDRYRWEWFRMISIIINHLVYSIASASASVQCVEINFGRLLYTSTYFVIVIVAVCVFVFDENVLPKSILKWLERRSSHANHQNGKNPLFWWRMLFAQNLARICVKKWTAKIPNDKYVFVMSKITCLLPIAKTCFHFS